MAMPKTHRNSEYGLKLAQKLADVRKAVDKSANEIIAARGADNNRLAEALRRTPDPRQSEAFITILGAFLQALKIGSTTPQQIHDYCVDLILRRSGGGSMTTSDQAELNVWAWIVNDIDLRAYLS